MLIDAPTTTPPMRPIVDAWRWLMRVTGSSGPRLAPAGRRPRRRQLPGFGLSGPAPRRRRPPRARRGNRGAARPAGHRRRRRRTGGAARFGEATSLLDRLDELRLRPARRRAYRWRRCRACGPSSAARPSPTGDAAPARAPGGDRRALRRRDRQAGGRGARSADLVSWRTMSQRPRGSRHRRRTCRNLPRSDRRSGARRHAPDCARSMRTRVP